MLTVSFYKCSSQISIHAYCDKYAISENGNIYFLSIIGADSAVRGIIGAVQTGENIRITKDTGGYEHCRKGITPLRSFTSRISYENMTHGICIALSAFGDNETREKFIFHDSMEILFAILHRNFAITAIPEWQDWLYNKLKEKQYLIPLNCYCMKSLLLDVTEEQLDEVISTGIKTRGITFSKQSHCQNSVLDEIEGVESYLEKFSQELGEKINRAFEPLYIPESGKWSPKISELKRLPFQAQGDVIMGSVECLKTNKTINIVGEMGVGKTLLGAAIPYVYSDTPSRSLIVCPGHLVRKWEAEVNKTIPKAKALIIRSFKDLQPLVEICKRKEKPTCYEYFIISKDKAKLSYFWKPGVTIQRDKCSCPQCGMVLKDNEGWNIPLSFFERKRRYCKECGSSLWQADNTKIDRFAPAEFIKRYLKGFFQFGIFDEMHELKGGAAAQGNILGMLSSCIPKVITLTGTFLGGYADDIFYILYRTNAKLMKIEGFEWGETQKWLERYGVLERVVKIELEGQDNSASRGNKRREQVKRKPGVSPLVYSKFLLGNTVFLQLDNVADNLPLFTEETISVSMNQELEEAYRSLNNILSSRVRQDLATHGHSVLLGSYLLSLLAYPDKPFQFGPILHPTLKNTLPPEYFYLSAKEQTVFLETMMREDALDRNHVLAIPSDLPQDNLYSKEETLLKILEQERKLNRRCFIFCIFTNLRDITSRLESFVQKNGFKVVTLRSTVEPEKREKWLAEKVNEGFDVVIGNPDLVKTGLDLLDFTTLIYYQTGYNTFTLRQSSRRSWRIGQKNEVKVFYLFYKNTMQERCLQLMGSKLQASMGIEGRFSEEGLAALSSGDDLMNALAKSLVGKLSQLDSVEQIWKRMAKKENGKHETNLSFHIHKNNGESQRKTVIVEIVKMNGKRRKIERIEAEEGEINKILKEQGTNAQLVWF